MDTNVLYYGDNLDILRGYIPAESVDLVYLDPPFNSNRTYSAIFADESGRKSDAQIHAFEDSWHWGPTPEAHLSYLKNSALHQGKVPVGVSQLLAALEFGIGKTPMLAYLVEMAVRLVELHRAKVVGGGIAFARRGIAAGDDARVDTLDVPGPDQCQADVGDLVAFVRAERQCHRQLGARAARAVAIHARCVHGQAALQPWQKGVTGVRHVTHAAILSCVRGDTCNPSLSPGLFVRCACNA